MHQDTIHIEITYNVPASKVWEALTAEEQIKEWYFDIENLILQKEASFTFYKTGFKREFLHHCKILDVKEEALLKYTWSYPELNIGESIVTWELIPRGGATSVRLTHEGLLQHKDAGESFSVDRFEAGWSDMLGKSLAIHLEK